MNQPINQMSKTSGSRSKILDLGGFSKDLLIQTLPLGRNHWKCQMNWAFLSFLILAEGGHPYSFLHNAGLQTWGAEKKDEVPSFKESTCSSKRDASNAHSPHSSKFFWPLT